MRDAIWKMRDFGWGMRNEWWGMKNEGSGWRVRGEEWRIKVNYTFLMDFGSEFCEKFVSPTNKYSKAWSLKKEI